MEPKRSINRDEFQPNFIDMQPALDEDRELPSLNRTHPANQRLRLATVERSQVDQQESCAHEARRSSAYRGATVRQRCST